MTDFEQKVIALADQNAKNNAHWAIELRKLVDEYRPKPQVPQALSMSFQQIDWSTVYRCVVDGVQEAFQQGWENEDNRAYIYEAAMTAVYGKDIFAKMRHLKS